MAKKINYEKLYTLRKDGRYQGYYYDDNGVRHCVTARTADEVYRRIEQANSPAKRTLADALADWETVRREQVTTRTWKNYEPHVRRLSEKFGTMELSSITGAMIAADLERMHAQDFSRTSINTRRVVWSGALRNEVVLGNLQVNPADSVRLPRNLKSSKRKALTDDEMKTILNNVDKPFGFFPFFLLLTGMRKSEALALLWRDVDFKRGVIHVTKSLEFVSTTPNVKQPKTEAGIRDVPIVAPLLPELRKRKGKANTPLFPAVGGNRAGAGGGYMTERGFEVAWRNYCEAVGLEGVTAHRLRHATATMFFEAGIDAETTRNVLGHSNINVTLDIYTELRDAKKMQDAEKFGAVMANLMQN